LVRDLVASASGVADHDDALDAELLGATFVAMAAEDLIPQVEATASREALALLLAVASVTTGEPERAAADGANRLVAAGIPSPRWAAELAEPARAIDCRRLHDPNETASVLVASFRRAHHEHAVLIVVDELDGGAAAAILLVHAEQLEDTLDDINAGPDLETQVLDEAGFRWYAEEALQAHAGQDDATADDDEEPPYPVLAVLVRSRLAGMAEARRPDGARRRRPAVTTVDVRPSL
jgi:hypothetical protein